MAGMIFQTLPRDLIKEYADGIDFILIGLENQMNIHHAMPVRSMLYEALDYTKQCKALEQSHRANRDLSGSDEFLSGLSPHDRIRATISLILYYGEKPWDGPLSLCDMMDIPPAFQAFFNNYSIHLLQICSAKNYHFQNQDNQDLFTLIGELYSNGKMDFNEFKRKYSDMDIYWETLAALGAITGSAELVEYAMRNEGGRMHMCTALENLIQEGIKEGIQEGVQKGIKEGVQKGIKEGIQKGIKEGIQKGIKEGIQKGIQEGIQKGIKEGEIRGMIKAYRDMNCSDDSILLKIKEKFQLSSEEAMDSLHQDSILK